MDVATGDLAVDAANRLKASGVTLVTVGLPGSDTTALDNMASSSDLSFHSIGQVVTDSITSLAGTPCTTAGQFSIM